MKNAGRMDAARTGELLLPHLETFAKAAELCSFTRAGQALHMTQAAVSQRVQALEKTLATPLFQRSGGRVMLTQAGGKLYDFAQRILDLHRQARQDVTGQAAPVGGELLLAASSIPGEHLLPSWLSVFGRQYPHIHVRATVSDSMEVSAQVERGDVSLGLLGRKTDSPHLEFRHLASDRMVLVVPAGHPLGKRKKCTARQIAAYPLVVRESGSGTRHFFEKTLAEAGLSLADFQIVLELGSNEAIKEAVLRGIGAAVLSVWAVQKELKTGQLRAVAISDLDAEREMFIVSDKRRVLPLPARLFLDFVQNPASRTLIEASLAGTSPPQ
jgi:DNA-binding transcriptional LysR family regulator